MVVTDPSETLLNLYGLQLKYPHKVTPLLIVVISRQGISRESPLLQGVGEGFAKTLSSSSP
jgi:hypothetical protein